MLLHRRGLSVLEIWLADRYGLQSGQPDWLPELITRYHLTPPPGA